MAKEVKQIEVEAPKKMFYLPELGRTVEAESIETIEIENKGSKKGDK